MTIALRQPPELADLLEWERRQEERFEFVGGILRAMVGGTLAHNQIIGNIVEALRGRLRGSPCRVFMEGVKVITADAFMYPDLVVTCSPVSMSADAVPDPVAIFEVLSKSTADHDRGAKWLACQTLPSLQQYVLVAQGRMLVETYVRAGDGWRYQRLDGPVSALDLPFGGAALTMAEIYEDAGPTAPA